VIPATIDTDVCVVGGGPAGSAAAASAARSGHRVVLVDGARRTGGGALEVMSARAREALLALDLYAIVTDGATRCDGTITRWSTASFVERSCLLAPHGAGWIVDRGRLDARLVAELSTRGIIVAHATASTVERSSCTRYVVGLDDRRTVNASAVVIATGRSPAPWRRRGNGPRRTLAMTVTLPAMTMSGFGSRLLIDHTPCGWWFAIADPARVVLTFCTDGDQLEPGRSRLRRTWSRACDHARDWLPAVAHAATPHVRPVGEWGADPGDGAVLVGDAAIAVDPLSGHGLTLAIESGMRHADSDYGSWLADTAAAHARRRQETYAAAVGDVGGPFWQRRRGASPH